MHSMENTSQDIRQLNEKIHQASAFVDLLNIELGKVIVGQRYMVERLLIGLLAQGHVLLEGVPGLAKTLSIKSLSSAINAKFSRIQFTPDLLPADVIGTMIYNQQRNEFVVRRGPIFANFILADEINRAPAKVQSALLEAMQERSVTVAGRTYKLDEPYIVLATQNPLEMEGTYPLPEAQLDRFLFKLKVYFPSLEELLQILNRTTGGNGQQPEPVIDAAGIMALRALVREVPAAPHVQEHAVRLVLGTHPDSEFATDQVQKFVRYGASPRGAQALILASKVRALLNGRFHVAFEDINFVARPALRHRMILNFEGQAEGIEADDLIEELLEKHATVPV